MLNSKLNVYSTEWLDVVFANRNQSYGAYELRKNYNSRLIKALFVASTVFLAGVCSPLIYDKLKKEDADDKPALPVLVDDDKVIVVALPPKKIEPPRKEGGVKPVEKVKTRQFIDMRVVPAQNATVEPPSQIELSTAAIGRTNIEGVETEGNLPSSLIEGHGGDGVLPGSGTSGAEGAEETFTIGSIERQPEFPGGMEAFSNYLRKNLRYPVSAAEAGASGRVYVNFVVEKDGTLTDIKVVKGIGFGCDEEAQRVLKKSPKWSPGEQNGRKVRVMYTVPIVFSMGE